MIGRGVIKAGFASFTLRIQVATAVLGLTSLTTRDCCGFGPVFEE